MNTIQDLLIKAIEIYEIIILARILLSWFQGPTGRGQIAQFIYGITEPLLAPIRRGLQRMIRGPLDFSPLVLILLLELLKSSIIRSTVFF